MRQLNPRCRTPLQRFYDGPWLLLAVAAFLMLMFAGLTAIAKGEPSPATRPVVGVWYQPASSFAKWQGRGVNTLIGYENEGGATSLDAWCKAASAAGIDYVLQASASPHWSDPHCVAVQYCQDEPNGGGNQTPDACLKLASQVRQQTPKPLFMNLDGWKLQYEPDADVWAYCLPADWIGIDYYVLNRGEPDGLKAWDAKVGQQVKRLQKLAPGKKIIVFVECDDQLLKKQGWMSQNDASGTPPATRARAPTVAEFLYEVRSSIGWGCDTAYFPDVIGVNWEAYDGVPDAIAGAMSALAR